MNQPENDPHEHAIAPAGRFLPEAGLPLSKPRPSTPRFDGGTNRLSTEKLAIGVSFLVVALGTAVAASQFADRTIRTELYQTALIVVIVSAGLTLLGGAEWLTATRSSPSVANELEKLAQLRDRGILTDEEFRDQKRRLLE